MEREQMRCTLEARQAELERLVRNRDAIVVDSSADVLDQIQRTSEREIAIGNLERESERLHEVRAALRRIDLGTYGICLDCNEEISINRLAALPWTASCLVCREAADGNRPLTQSAFERPLLTVTCPSM